MHLTERTHFQGPGGFLRECVHVFNMFVVFFTI